MQMQQLGIDKSRLAAEKAELENQLEAEQEYIMHKLNRQVLIAVVLLCSRRVCWHTSVAPCLLL